MGHSWFAWPGVKLTESGETALGTNSQDAGSRPFWCPWPSVGHMRRQRQREARRKGAWLRIFAIPLTSCVTLKKLFFLGTGLDWIPLNAKFLGVLRKTVKVCPPRPMGEQAPCKATLHQKPASKPPRQVLLSYPHSLCAQHILTHYF